MMKAKFKTKREKDFFYLGYWTGERDALEGTERYIRKKVSGVQDIINRYIGILEG